MYAQMTLDFTGGPGVPGPAPLQPAAWRPVEELADVLAGTWFLCYEDEVRSVLLPLTLEGYDPFLRALYGRNSFLWLNPAGSASVLAGSGGAGVEVRAVRQLRVQGYGDHACLHLDAWGTSGAYMGFALTVGIPPDLQRFRAVARDAGRRRMR